MRRATVLASLGTLGGLFLGVAGCSDASALTNLTDEEFGRHGRAEYHEEPVRTVQEAFTRMDRTLASIPDDSACKRNTYGDESLAEAMVRRSPYFRAHFPEGPEFALPRMSEAVLDEFARRIQVACAE